MHPVEYFARAHAQRVHMEKQAGVGDALGKAFANPGAAVGAGLGSVYGAVQGARGSREGEKGDGALTGAALGALGGGFLGGSAVSLAKNVPQGFALRKKGLEGLEKEYMAAKGLSANPTDAKALREYRKGFKEHIATRKEQMGAAQDLASAGKTGKEARDAIDAVRKSDEFANVGRHTAGKEKLFAGGLFGTAGLGYGAYQLKDTKNINRADPQEAALKQYISAQEKSASFEAAERVGRMLAGLSY